MKDGRVITYLVKRAKQDQSIKGYKKLLETEPEGAENKADLIIKNAYRTLITRGMEGCYLYCTYGETGSP